MEDDSRPRGRSRRMMYSGSRECSGCEVDAWCGRCNARGDGSDWCARQRPHHARALRARSLRPPVLAPVSFSPVVRLRGRSTRRGTRGQSFAGLTFGAVACHAGQLALRRTRDALPHGPPHARAKSLVSREGRGPSRSPPAAARASFASQPSGSLRSPQGCSLAGASTTQPPAPAGPLVSRNR